MIFKAKNNQMFSILKNFLLYFSIVFFSLFSTVPIKFFSFINIFPNIASILVFFFLIKKRYNINYFSIFTLGIFFDVFNDLPIGLTSLTWLITSKFVNFLMLKLYNSDNFLITFRDFSIYAFLNSFIQWSILGLLHRNPYPFFNSFVEFILNLIFFAILYKFLKKIEGFFI